MYETLQAKAYRTIRERLLSGVDPQGTRISDYVLSKSLGISRAPIREAMNRLISERLLVQKAGLGVFVPQPSREEIKNLYQVREWLEIGALETVVGRLDPAALQIMQDSCSAIRRMAEDLEQTNSCLERGTSFPRLSVADSEFHLTIMRATDNKLLLDLIQSNRVLEQVWDISVRTYSAEVVHRICDEHEEILAAIKSRDLELSRQTLCNHLRIGRNITLRHYDQQLLQD
ncbi:GntR family transcriptional regulator [Gimesia sp.]|uniref:GntR family transcriptional regulator n=1 Tax=Gimesia sp. TaxID=2024833 RepID=UPI003A8EC811